MDFVALATISEFLLMLVFPQAGAGAGSDQGIGFTFNGFRSVKLELDGFAEFTNNGLLRLTNETREMMAHAFYPDPVPFKNSSEGSVFSFSTTFVFAIISKDPAVGGPGIAFVAAPQRGLPGAFPNMYLGLFNKTNNGDPTNHVFAIELDAVQTADFKDIDNNHLGIDINGLVSAVSASAGYYPDGGAGKFENLTLVSGRPMQVWVDYDGIKKRIEVTLAPFKAVRPSTPLLSLSLDLSTIVKETMFVGFSSSTVLILGLFYYVRRKRKYAEVLEDWELCYGPHRFKYKDLYIATRGFRDQELLGTGGFGSVYRGILPTSKFEIAVKRISHNSKQGIREFVAEIVSIGRLRHRNLVTLLGYCRRKGELLLVYDYMPNGSLDKYLFNQPKVTLNWTQRFRVIRGVASGLLYLHEGWDRVVIHRDIKSSNVLLDAELNGRLGDFGLARLYDHGTYPQTTHVAGTFGYLAPEHTRTGRATKATDVFAFGAFLLEVATGRRPIEARGTEDLILVDWVFYCWSRGGEILEARDPNLSEEFVAEEVELVLKLGLVCSHPEPGARPTMRQVVQYLEGDAPIQHLSSSLDTYSSGLRIKLGEGFDDFAMPHPSSMDNGFSTSSTVADSLLSGGR
ncbi:L-type lectin-domain containing receptor kinase IV.1-like [Punica granatum]|uniref:non-specific serine/threonine protein kinase n=2 Tax=Punica granatum TaxID=22663 RepID=A0A6P8E2F0_PUNGR|nr:L-type lectin-domain containing receptor kinase IV.1-like [Punica granatum]